MEKADLIYKIVDKIDTKMDRLDARVDTIGLDVAKNTLDLSEHMRRSLANESRLNLIEHKLTITYLLKVVSSAVLTSGAIAGAIYKIIQLTGK